jgi:hypothetical protein
MPDEKTRRTSWGITKSEACCLCERVGLTPLKTKLLLTVTGKEKLWHSLICEDCREALIDSPERPGEKKEESLWSKIGTCFLLVAALMICLLAVSKVLEMTPVEAPRLMTNAEMVAAREACKKEGLSYTSYGNYKGTTSVVCTP